MKKLNVTAVSFTEARNILDKIPEESLGYEQKITLEYLKTRSKVSKKDLEAAIEELKGIEGVKDTHIAQLLSLFPKDADEVKIMFMKDRTALEDSAVKKILEAIDKVRPEKK